MINLDQVRTLEWKVKQAVQLIVHLRRENDTLRGRLSDTELRLVDLETSWQAFKAQQGELESGIRSALKELDGLGDTAPSDVDARVDHVPATSFSLVEPDGQVSRESSPPDEPSSPDSIELVDGAALAEEPEIYETPAEDYERQDEAEPEQPGLGIF